MSDHEPLEGVYSGPGLACESCSHYFAGACCVTGVEIIQGTAERAHRTACAVASDQIEHMQHLIETNTERRRR